MFRSMALLYMNRRTLCMWRYVVFRFRFECFSEANRIMIRAVLELIALTLQYIARWPSVERRTPGPPRNVSESQTSGNSVSQDLVEQSGPRIRCGVGVSVKSMAGLGKIESPDRCCMSLDMTRKRVSGVRVWRPVGRTGSAHRNTECLVRRWNGP